MLVRLCIEQSRSQGEVQLDNPIENYVDSPFEWTAHEAIDPNGDPLEMLIRQEEGEADY